MEPDESDAPGMRRTPLLGVGLLFAVIAVLIGTDLVLDARAGTAVGHLLVEGLATALAVAGAGAAWQRWLEQAVRSQAAIAEATRRARAWEAEAARWRGEAQEVVRGLGEAIDRQFDRWDLTTAEREVALLLLKGLAMKEVADVRGTSERTVREQARAVYAKADLAGRAELSAFFLEDLLLPARPPNRPGEGP